MCGLEAQSRTCERVIGHVPCCGASRGQLDEVLVPYPADQVVSVILILRKPELALLANDIEDLEHEVSTASNRPSERTSNLLHPPRRSDRDSLLLSVHDQY